VPVVSSEIADTIRFLGTEKDAPGFADSGMLQRSGLNLPPGYEFKPMILSQNDASTRNLGGYGFLLD